MSIRCNRSILGRAEPYSEPISVFSAYTMSLALTLTRTSARVTPMTTQVPIFLVAAYACSIVSVMPMASKA